jgi:hypothetical protein
MPGQAVIGEPQLDARIAGIGAVREAGGDVRQVWIAS